MKKYISVLALSLFLAAASALCGPVISAEAAPITITYDGEEHVYDGTQVSYTLDGQTLPSDYPGIIIDDISLASCKEIFVNGKTGITSKYSSRLGRVYLYHGNDVIKFQFGAEEAEVNGEMKKLPLAARLITMPDGAKKIYVPARFVAENFGFTYVWNAATGVASMTSSSKPITVAGKKQLYDNWEVLFTIEGKKTNTEALPGIILSDTTMAPVKAVFAGKAGGCTYALGKNAEGKRTITLSKCDHTLILTVGSRYADLDGTVLELTQVPVLVKFAGSGKSAYYVPFVDVASALDFTVQRQIDTEIDLGLPHKLYDQGKWQIIDTMVNVSVNNEKVELGSAFGFLDQDTAMVPASTVFKKALGCDYSYVPSASTLTLHHGEHTLILILGEDTCYLDGEKLVLPATPRKVKPAYGTSNYLYVPAAEVAEALEIEYNFIAESNIAKFTIPEETPETPVTEEPSQETPAGEKPAPEQPAAEEPAAEQPGGETPVTVDPKPEQPGTEQPTGGEPTTETPSTEQPGTQTPATEQPGTQTPATEQPGTETPVTEDPTPVTPETPVVPITPEIPEEPEVVSLPDAVLFAWAGAPAAPEGTDALTGGVFNLAGRTIQPGTTIYPAVKELLVNQEKHGGSYDTFDITSDTGFGNVEGTFADGKLVLTLKNMTFGSRAEKYYPDGYLIRRSTIEYDQASNTTTITMTAVDSVHDCRVSLSDDLMQLHVQFIRGDLTTVTGSYISGQYQMIVNANCDFSADVIQSANNLITLKISGVSDAIGTQFYEDTVNLYPELDRVDYTTDESGNILVTFTVAGDITYELQKGSGQATLMLRRGASVPITMKIPLMPGTVTSSIQAEDDYRNRTFYFTIPGDQRAYLDAVGILNTNANVTSVSYALDGNGNTRIAVKTGKLQAYKLSLGNGVLNVRIDDPRNLYSKIIILDPGHGGSDVGAAVGSIYEKDITLSILYNHLSTLVTDPDLKVYWTRTGDDTLTLSQRAVMAKNYGADLFVSLHMNSAPSSPGASGTETYYSSKNNTLTASGLNSYKLASLLQNNLVSGLGTVNRKVKDNVFYVTYYNSVPAILIELGFMTNSSELARLQDASYQQRAAEIIYQSIEDAFEAYPTGR